MPPADVPVPDAELVARQVLLHFYPDPNQPKRPQFVAFRPTDQDHTGISLLRPSLTPEPVLFSRTGRPCHIAVFEAGEVRKLGTAAGLSSAVVVEDPQPKLPGHARIPCINTADYASKATKGQLVQLITSIIAVGLVRENPGPTPP